MDSIYISVAEFIKNGGTLSPYTRLYYDFPKFGFDSCDAVRFNNIEGQESEFYVKVESSDTRLLEGITNGKIPFLRQVDDF